MIANTEYAAVMLMYIVHLTSVVQCYFKNLVVKKKKKITSTQLSESQRHTGGPAAPAAPSLPRAPCRSQTDRQTQLVGV